MTTQSKEYFPRAGYAKELAENLLASIPGGTIYSSGLFIAGIRRIGKSTFLKNDLIPEIERCGGIAIYIDLSSNSKKTQDPEAAIFGAIEARHAQIASQIKTSGGPIARMMDFLKKKISADESQGLETTSLEITKKVGGSVAGFGGERSVTRRMERSSLGSDDDVLKESIERLIRLTGMSVVLIVDEVQIALEGASGKAAMWGLKSARDNINVDKNTPGRFLFVGTGSQTSMVRSMAARRSEAYFGSAIESFRCLGDDFLMWYKDKQTEATPSQRWPSDAALSAGFSVLGKRPENLTWTLHKASHTGSYTGSPRSRDDGDDFDKYFLDLCHENILASNESESGRLRELGDLCCAIYDRLCGSALSNKVQVYSAQAMDYYRQRTQAKVTSQDVQAALNKLMGANFVCSVGVQHDGGPSNQGHYNAVDENFAEYHLDSLAAMYGAQQIQDVSDPDPDPDPDAPRC